MAGEIEMRDKGMKTTAAPVIATQLFVCIRATLTLSPSARLIFNELLICSACP